MGQTAIVEWFMVAVAGTAKELLLPALVFVFLGGVLLRGLIYYTVKRNDWFAKEFEKRLNRFAETEGHRTGLSFYVTAKMLLERTYYELFEVRAIMKRRKTDWVMAPTDRIFLVQAGTAFLVKDTLKQVRFLRYGGEHPKFLEISKAIFQNNPCFNRLFGVIPAAPLNDLLSALPGLLIIGGIFGTFLGIIRALPDLGGMNLNDVEGTKLVMDTFLTRISFSMSASAVGILLSVLMTVTNTFLAPERVFVDIVNRYELALEFLWRRCENNELPESIPGFDEHRDPIDALAEYSVQQQIIKREAKSGGRPSQPQAAPAAAPMRAGAIPSVPVPAAPAQPQEPLAAGDPPGGASAVDGDEEKQAS